MPIFSEPASVIERRKPVVVEGDTYYKSDWMDTGCDPAFSPTSFLVEQQPDVSLRTHFHRHDQFQLFVRGSGTIGRHPLGALMVHYASAYSAYGPIVAGPEGLAYFTLRTVHETGSLTMKDHADQMQRGPKRQLHSEVARVADETERASLAAPKIDDLIPLQPDGAAAQLISLPPGATHAGLDPRGSGGQLHLVAAGSLVVDGRALAQWEHVFVAGDETPPVLVAGRGGAQAVLLQFPGPRA